MKQLRVEEIPYKYEIGEIVKGIKILKQGYTIRKDNNQKIKSYTALNLEYNIEINIREDVLKASKSNSVFPRKYKKQINSIKLKRPDLTKYLYNKEDSIKTLGSNDVIVVKCPNKNCGFKKNIKVFRLVQRGFNCKFCSDKTSFPQKVLSAYLELNNINYEDEVFLPNGMRMDFIFESKHKKIAVEVNGNQHYSNSSNWGNTVKKHKQSLEYKKKYCQDNNIEFIEIDCRNSDLSWIKKNMIESGFEYMVSNISDNVIFKTISSKEESVLKCVELYNKGFSIRKISQEMKFSQCKVTGILKRTIGYETLSVGERNSRKVKCINTGEIFNSSTKAKEWAVKSSKIDAACRGERNSAGKHPVTGEKLRWEYVEEE